MLRFRKLNTKEAMTVGLLANSTFLVSRQFDWPIGDFARGLLDGFGIAACLLGLYKQELAKRN